MLSDRCSVYLSVLSCPVCLSGLSVTLVYCGQLVGWIKMKLGTEVGLGLSHIVLDGDPALLKRGTAPNSRPMSIVAKRSPMQGTVEHLYNMFRKGTLAKIEGA